VNRRAGAKAPGRQTMVRGLRIACRNISVSLKDAGPRVAGSTEKDALRRSSTHWHGGPRHVRLRRHLDKKSPNQFKTILEARERLPWLLPPGPFDAGLDAFLTQLRLSNARNLQGDQPRGEIGCSGREGPQ
jgi:hypothetical protein